jgi:Uma2 family endonuclease
MRSQVALQKFTRTDFHQLPEGFRAELIDGELVKMTVPTWGHQRLVSEIYEVLVAVGAVAAPGPVGFDVDEFNILVPDVVAVATEPSDETLSITEALAVFEVLSPSTAVRDRKVKVDLYLEAGVREVWLVDPKSETIAVHQARESKVYADDDVAESRAIPGFRLVPATLFARR